MDGQSFDSLTKALSAAATRRVTLLTLLNVLLALRRPGAEVAVGKNRSRRHAHDRQREGRHTARAEKKGKKKGKKGRKKKCKGGKTRCGKTCVDTKNDNDNCGGCGRTCAAPGSCQNGVCTCSGGVYCDGECVAGGQCCDAGDCDAQACQAGACVDNACVLTPAADNTPCGNGICCGGECIDPLSDQHCGRCGNACEVNEVCADGSACVCKFDACGQACCAQGERCCGGHCAPVECCDSTDCPDYEAPICAGNQCVACQEHGECSAAGKGNLCCAPHCFSGDCCDAAQCAGHLDGPICTAEGQCIACVTPSDCPLPECCRIATCSAAGDCGTTVAPDGPSETCPRGECCEGTCCSDGEICYQGNCCYPPTECPADVCGIYQGNCGVAIDCRDNCTEGSTCCGESCRNLAVDFGNCGTCGHGCDTTAGEYCSDGQCVDHCGHSCNAAAGEFCFDGHCAIQCGLERCAVDGPVPDCCNSHCTNTQADADNCGECGMICSFPHALTRCLNGTCAIRACHAGYGNCDGQTDTGCETNTQTDLNHCGACGNACTGGNVCLSGNCVLPLWAHQTAFGSSGSEADRFSEPHGVAVSRDGLTAFVADTFNHRVSVWVRSSDSSTDWSNQTIFGSGPGSGADQFNFPAGVALSRMARRHSSRTRITSA